jgi:hypothetical protein
MSETEEYPCCLRMTEMILCRRSWPRRRPSPRRHLPPQAPQARTPERQNARTPRCSTGLAKIRNSLDDLRRQDPEA